MSAGPELVAVDGPDDYAVALAVAVAREALGEWVPVLGAGDTELHAELETGRLFPPETWRTYQQLWYRWQAPHDSVSPRQWYLAALAGRTCDTAEEISETVDRWLAQPVADAVRDAWCALAEEQRTETLEHLHERLAILGPVRVDVVGRPVDNESGLALAESCLARPPADWTYAQLVFATALWLWDLGDIGFTELNQGDLTLSVLDGFFRAKRSRYLGLLGREDDTPAHDLLAVARSLPALRREVEAAHVRCFRIDGGSWERREHFLTLESVQVDDVPEDYAAHIRRALGVSLPARGGHRERFAGLVDRLLAQGTNPAEALVATAQHVLANPQLHPDYVVLTAARGVGLDEPWALDLGDVFSHVAVNEDCDPAARGVRLQDHQIRNAIAQRMRYNVTCRGRNYSPHRAERLKAQPFQFPDVAIMEDAHHTGHRAAGIRLVARAPFPLEVPGGQTWRGLADLRINRVSHREGDSYALADLPLVVRYSLWCKAIVEAAYARGQLLDERYCAKQPIAAAGPPPLVHA